MQPGLSKIGRMLAAGLATMVFAGCSAGPSPATSAAAPLVGEECPDLVDGGTQVRFTDAHGAELTGVTLGTGRTGVVLAHMSDGDVCGWLAYARQIARDGYRVMVFYFHGFGTSGGADGSTLDGDVLAAAEYLRGHGAQPIALLGASMGGTASLVAATELRPPPAVVISLSAPKYYQGLDALAAAAKLTAPVLYAAGVSDNDYADQAQVLYDATPGTDRTILLAPTTAHGTGMVGAPGSQVRDAMDKALRERAPAGG